jgi:hypothetical protein
MTDCKLLIAISCKHHLNTALLSFNFSVQTFFTNLFLGKRFRTSRYGECFGNICFSVAETEGPDIWMAIAWSIIYCLGMGFVLPRGFPIL